MVRCAPYQSRDHGGPLDRRSRRSRSTSIAARRRDRSALAFREKVPVFPICPPCCALGPPACFCAPCGDARPTVYHCGMFIIPYGGEAWAFKPGIDGPVKPDGAFLYRRKWSATPVDDFRHGIGGGGEIGARPQSSNIVNTITNSPGAVQQNVVGQDNQQVGAAAVVIQRV